MTLAQEEFGALALETAMEEVGAELENVAGLLLDDLTIEGVDFVLVIGRE